MPYQSIKPDKQIDPKIIEATERLLASESGTGFTMDQLAEAAGLSRASVYRRIGSKDALLQQIAQMRGISPEELGQRDIRTGILRAARQLFGQQGLVGVTMEQIAQEADVGVATVYRHFGDKAGLIRAFSDEYKPQQLLAETAFTTTGDLEADLIQLVAGLLTFMHKNRDIFRLVLAEDRADLELIRSVRDAPERTLNRLARLFQQQIDAGQFMDGDPMDMAVALMGMVLSFGFMVPLLYDMVVDDRAGTARSIVQIFLNGVRSDSESGKSNPMDKGV